MYRKISNSWFKHWDFIILDAVMLQIAYIVSCNIRNGWSNPYNDEVYLNIGVIIFFADICTVFFVETYHGIMRRGYFEELKMISIDLQENSIPFFVLSKSLMTISAYLKNR